MGSHEKLVEANGLYHRFFKLQTEEAFSANLD
jgi:hypothetical protein